MFCRHVFIISSKFISNSSIPCHQQNFKLLNYSKIAFIKQLLFGRYLSTAPEELCKEAGILDLNQYKLKKCPVVKYIRPKLQQLLNLSPTEVKEMIQKYPDLKYSNCERIQNNYNICTEAGITNDILTKYPIILTLDLLKQKVEYLQKLDVDINFLAPLVIADVNVLREMVLTMKSEEDMIPFGNRIVYLSNELNIPGPEICEKIIKHPFVLRLWRDRLSSILKVLLDYGVEPRNILNDCWSLRYSAHLAEERLQRAMKANVVKVKTWMIRCPDKVFERCINRQIENRTVLGSHSSVEEYLSKRLECSIENAKFLTEKYPAIKKMNILKMKEILDYLYEQGYTPIHVWRVPRIMVHSQETTKLRMQQLKQLGYTQPSLAILCKSKRDYDKIYKKYNKRNKNSEKGSSKDK